MQESAWKCTPDKHVKGPEIASSRSDRRASARNLVDGDRTNLHLELWGVLWGVLSLLWIVLDAHVGDRGGQERGEEEESWHDEVAVVNEEGEEADDESSLLM